MWTIGGGMVLDVLPPRRTTLKRSERELLEALIAHDLSSAAIGLLASRAMPMTSAQVAVALGVPRAGVADDLNRAKLERLKIGSDAYFVTPEALDELLGSIERELLAYHDASPKSTGIASLALRDRVDRRIEPKVFDALLGIGVERGSVALAGGEVRHPLAASTAIAEEAGAREAILPALERVGLSPGTVAELASEIGMDAGVVRKALTKLVAEGAVVRLGPDLHFDAAAVAEARAKIVGFLRENTTMLARDARDVTGSSRKYIVPLLEYFDAQGITKRDGDVRTLGRLG